MKTAFRFLLSVFRSPVFFANQATAEESQTFANHLVIKEGGWVQLAPYGDARNVDAKGNAVIQRFEKSDAQAIVNEFTALLNTPQRLLGLPWYIGHPDHPRFKADHKDTRAYGRIKQLEARDDGLYANVKWSAAGKQLLDDEAFHGHSVNWRAVPAGAVRGVTVFRPLSLKSVGFTNEPNVPVMPASLANEDLNQDTTMIPKFLLKLLGFADDATPTEEETKAKCDALANEKIALEKAKTDAETALANIKTERDTLLGEKTTLATQFANERKARSTVLVDVAIGAGKLTKANRDTKIEELANAGDAFDTKARDLANAKPVLKTDTLTNGLGKRNSEELANVATRSQKVATLMSERAQAYPEESYDQRFAAVRSANAELFAAMQQPGAAK